MMHRKSSVEQKGKSLKILMTYQSLINKIFRKINQGKWKHILQNKRLQKKYGKLFEFI